MAKPSHKMERMQGLESDKAQTLGQGPTAPGLMYTMFSIPGPQLNSSSIEWILPLSPFNPLQGGLQVKETQNRVQVVLLR